MALPGQKTFLQIQAQLGSQILGTQAGTSPYWDTTTRPTLSDVKQLINDAYRELMSKAEWWFLFRELTFNTVIGQTTPYGMDPTADAVMWMTIPAKQLKLFWLAESDWKVQWPGGYTNMGNMLPTFYTPAPPDSSTNVLQYNLGPGPADQIYTVRYGLKIRVTDLSGDTDVPVIRPEWQDVFILAAKLKIFDWLGDVARVQETKALYDERYRQMWKFDQETEESSWRMRSTYDEQLFSPYTNQNIALFVPFGR